MTYFIKRKKLPVQGQKEVSHLCHNAKCINIEHLSLEPPKVNNSRVLHCVDQQSCVQHWHEGRRYADCIFF